MVSGKSDLAVKIEEVLENDDRTKDAQIGAVDNNGVVTLTGRAADDKTRRAAQKIVESMSGVISVTSDIELGEDTLKSDLTKQDGDDVLIVPPPINQANQ